MQRNNKLLLIAIPLLIVAAALGYYFLVFAKTPAFTVNEVRKAVQNHDPEKFAQYVDVNSVMSHAFDDILLAKSKIDDDNILSNPFAVSILHMIKPQVVRLMGDEALNRIANKKEDEKKISRDPVPDAMRRNLERNIPMDRLKLKDISIKTKNDKEAVASVVLHNDELDKDFTLDILMQPGQEGYWRVTRISNLADFIVELDKARDASREERNKPMLDRMGRAFSISDKRLTLSSNTKEPRLDIDFNLRNNTGKNINRFYYDVEINDKEGNQVYSCSEKYNGKIAPTQVVKAQVSKALSLEVSANRELLAYKADSLDFRVVATHIYFDDGSVMETTALGR